jgi:hypothetical protein
MPCIDRQYHTVVYWMSRVQSQNFGRRDGSKDPGKVAASRSVALWSRREVFRGEREGPTQLGPPESGEGDMVSRPWGGSFSLASRQRKVDLPRLPSVSQSRTRSMACVHLRNPDSGRITRQTMSEHHRPVSRLCTSMAMASCVPTWTSRSRFDAP